MIDFGKYLDTGWNKATVLKIISYISLTALISATAWVGRKLFEFGKVMQRLDSVEKDIKGTRAEVRKGSKDLAKRIDDLMITIAQSGITEAHSPRQLTPEGLRILQSSGIDEIVNDKFELLIKKVESKKPENAYQAEKAIIDVVRGLTENAAIKDAVEEGAFNSGSLANVVLFVGAIYIRDRILAELHLRPEELDTHVA